MHVYPQRARKVISDGFVHLCRLSTILIGCAFNQISTSHAVGALDQLAFTWFLRAGSFCDSESIINSESSSHGTRWYAEEDRALSWSITFAYCTNDEIDCPENLRAWPWPCHLCTRAPRRSIVNGRASNDNDEHVSDMLVVSSRHALDHAFSALHHVRIKRRKLA
jgi:hypothetical protein